MPFTWQGRLGQGLTHWRLQPMTLDERPLHTLCLRRPPTHSTPLLLEKAPSIKRPPHRCALLQLGLVPLVLKRLRGTGQRRRMAGAGQWEAPGRLFSGQRPGGATARDSPVRTAAQNSRSAARFMRPWLGRPAEPAAGGAVFVLCQLCQETQDDRIGCFRASSMAAANPPAPGLDDGLVLCASCWLLLILQGCCHGTSRTSSTMFLPSEAVSMASSRRVSHSRPI